MYTRPWITLSHLDNPSSIDAEDAIQAASFILYMLSGQKYPGIQSVTEQYFCEESGAPVGCVWDPGNKRFWNSSLNIWAWSYGRGPTSNSNVLLRGRRIRLQHRPVVEVTQVTIGGTDLDPSEYSLLNGEILAREGSWGLCDGPVVTYSFGANPPALGRMAARRLANELVMAASGDENCALPAGTTSVSRQGIDLQIFDPQDFMDKGRTGLYEVDLFLAVVNPGKARKRPRVFSPDMPRGYRRSN